MTTLHDRLTDLAEDAPSPRPTPELWNQGTLLRRRRRGRTAAVTVATLVALSVLGCVGWVRSARQAELVPAGAPAGLPDRLYQPSPWLPGTDDAGPPGRLAALIPAARGSWSGMRPDEVVGVSAQTGEYRFLDLPGLVKHPEWWALSPDGMRVAYVYRKAGSSVPDEAGTGLAIYDATSGQLVRHPLPGARGIMADAVAWAGPDVVVLDYGTVDDNGYGGVTSWTGRPLLVWPLDQPGPHELSGLRSRSTTLVAAGAGVAVVDDGTRGFLVDLGDSSRLRLTFDPAIFAGSVLDPSGSRLAALTGGMAPGPVGTAAVGQGLVRFVDVPDSGSTYEIVGWADDGRLALIGAAARDGSPSMDIRTIDPATGRSRLLVRDGSLASSLAADLLGAPTVAAVRPPRPLDPRLEAGLAFAIVLAGLCGCLLWRRRVRP
jgi:hypothetical protein